MGMTSLSKVVPLFKRLSELGFVRFSSILNRGRDEQHSIASGRDYASVALFKRYDSFRVGHHPFRHALERIELV